MEGKGGTRDEEEDGNPILVYGMRKKRLPCRVCRYERVDVDVCVFSNFRGRTIQTLRVLLLLVSRCVKTTASSSIITFTSFILGTRKKTITQWTSPSSSSNDNNNISIKSCSISTPSRTSYQRTLFLSCSVLTMILHRRRGEEKNNLVWERKLLPVCPSSLLVTRKREGAE